MTFGRLFRANVFTVILFTAVGCGPKVSVSTAKHFSEQEMTPDRLALAIKAIEAQTGLVLDGNEFYSDTLVWVEFGWKPGQCQALIVNVARSTKLTGTLYARRITGSGVWTVNAEVKRQRTLDSLSVSRALEQCVLQPLAQRLYAGSPGL